MCVSFENLLVEKGSFQESLLLPYVNRLPLRGPESIGSSFISLIPNLCFSGLISLRIDGRSPLFIITGSFSLTRICFVAF